MFERLDLGTQEKNVMKNFEINNLRCCKKEHFFILFLSFPSFVNAAWFFFAFV